MDITTYYRDHWVHVEQERLEGYEKLFAWQPAFEPFIAPAKIGEGQVVLDFGCGPGHTAVELAQRVGESGHVHGVDINAEFIARASRRAEQAGFGARMSFHQVSDGKLPLEDDSVDRVFCKSVLEYVPDVVATLRELRRVLRAGGLAHSMVSVWGFVVVEPWDSHTVFEFLDAGAPAFKEPCIGRKLPGAFQEAGFRDIEFQCVPIVDREGWLFSALQNVARYARALGTKDDAWLDGLLAQAEAAKNSGDFLMILPQFLATGTA
jgi:ubiquinone/menaquinone biosynthesis C-methylase UbiE